MLKSSIEIISFLISQVYPKLDRVFLNINVLKELYVRQKYSATSQTCIFNSLFGLWKCHDTFS